MGTIFLVIFTRPSAAVIGRAKRAPHWGVQSRFREIYMSVCRMSVVCLSYVKLTALADLRTAHAHAQSLFLAVKPVTPVLFISYTLEL